MATKKKMEKILLVDDDPGVLATLTEVLSDAGYRTHTATDGAEAVAELDKQFFDVVVTDLNMPGMDGMGVLKHLQKHSQDTQCLVLTGFGSIRNSVEAIKMGAFDYITKPVKFDELLHSVSTAIKFKRLERENTILKKQLKKKYRFENFVGDSPQIQRVFELIEKVADTDSTVLITGESGTGKELIARAIHYNSPRRDDPMVIINCGAIPEELLESELFGHEKGAFTGAHKTRIGRFEVANGGTIFLDEIGDMSPNLQVKLLRVIQEQAFERIGSTRTMHVDIRILAATNKDLMEAVEKKEFREDLYYRLNVIPIEVPPLRDRKSDIPLLIDFFINKLAAEKERPVKRISQAAMNALMGHHWPGNVRELENVVERVLILSSGDTIDKEDLPATILGLDSKEPEAGLKLPSGGIRFDHAVEEYEKNLIVQALEEANWVKTQAAKLLHINRTTLVEKMKRKNIRGPN
ncbi:sigma-54-dependent transcriptional regulator [Desulfatibacillum aliphaticivorans]|uniref:Two-component, sigma54 specific, transcriptional regulator, Fis family n=1 Tax=Desulfatibacillum aliphaticivorans TaxID=218208 RepID=B8FJT8_DESAL|nr:sigma-54 dependent transcriptional regulator [Desulfatibacillum aliphaticivorans]ACL02366.1 Two-component, sigma54 specific, transcriptional regulator, Fis family [Desulfatibacillum aliphaticivorans]